MRLALPCLCLVTDRRRCADRRLDDVVADAVSGGVGMVQLREKDLSAKQLYHLALCIRDVISGKALLFINDRVDVALACGADGVQLGEEALPLDVARSIAGDGMILGRSVHSVEGAVLALAQGADMLTLGTIFPTDSHPDAQTGGLELVKQVADAVSVPVLAIGGIDAANGGAAIAAGASGLAVITAITQSPNPAEASNALMNSMNASWAVQRQTGLASKA